MPLQARPALIRWKPMNEASVRTKNDKKKPNQLSNQCLADPPLSLPTLSVIPVADSAKLHTKIIDVDAFSFKTTNSILKSFPLDDYWIQTLSFKKT